MDIWNGRCCIYRYWGRKYISKLKCKEDLKFPGETEWGFQQLRMGERRKQWKPKSNLGGLVGHERK